MKDTEDGRVRCRRHQTGSRVEARALEVQHSRGGEKLWIMTGIIHKSCCQNQVRESLEMNGSHTTAESLMDHFGFQYH